VSNENSNSMKGLIAHIDIRVRFSETDAMGVIWHGNYLKFFEDARENFGKEFELEYLTMYDAGYFTPIIESKIEHKNPIHYGQTIRVTAKFIKLPSAKIKFVFEVFNLSTEQLVAKGHTIQVFLNVETSTLKLIKPDFFTEWEKKQNWIDLD
jgi:acyl-CoA thioester hydrolase